MSGDYSRSSFDALRDFAGVLMQQGHPTLDADWNDYVAIIERRLRAETVDIIGRAVVPRETPTGFQIGIAAGPTLTIGRGRMYVDGLLAENHGRIAPPDAPPVLDRARTVDGRAVGVLDELISTEANDAIDYRAQPYLPAAPDLPDGGGPHIVYLDVWRREVTPLQDPRLLEPALGGIDTATRWQTVWQVRVLPNVGDGIACGDPVAAWDALTAPSPARLTNATIEFEDPDEPCLIPPGGGYRGLENQFYRVEIHSGGALGTARFKWSRDNASVGATIESIDNGDRIQIRRIGRDSVLRFRTGDWVEITDDRREFAGLSGDMRRIEVDEDTNSILTDTPISADLIPGGGTDTAASRHSRVIKWDQSGPVLLADGTAWTDLDDDASDGLIPVPDDGSAVVLEAGITVSFTSVVADGAFRPADHWTFAARTATASIDPLTEAPPQGIHHHHARLAVITFPETVIDCRTFWPPQFGEGEECGCTVCVSAEAHNSGALTIQAAINQLPAEGGTVCLGPGGYALGSTPVTIANRRSVRLRGHGPGSLLAYAGGGGAIRVTGGNDVRISDIGLLVAALREGQGSASAIHIRNGVTTSVSRVTALVFAQEGRTTDLGIAIDGIALNLAIDDNLIFAPIAIGALAARGREGNEDGPGYCALLEMGIAENILFGQRRGISLDGAVLHLGAVRIADNLITGGQAAIVATGAGLPVGEDDGGRDQRWSAAALTIAGNMISFNRIGNGVISAVPDLRVLNNEIVATGAAGRLAGGNGIRLVEGLSPLPLPDAQIIGNRIGNCDGAGIRIGARQSSLIIKQNVIRDCDGGGIATAPEATIRTLALDNNVIERIGMTEASQPVAAVGLGAILDARIIGNSIRDVGSAAEGARGGYFAGIELRGAAMLDLSHNHITGLGSRQSLSPAIGVLIDGPLLAATIADNKILSERPAERNDPGSWAAILIEGRIQRQRETEGDGIAPPSPFPAFVAQGTALFAVSAIGIAAFATARASQIRIAGNIVRDAHEQSALPLIRLRANPEFSESCLFTDNQCLLQAGGRVRFLVELQAARMVATSNVVRRTESDGDAIGLECNVINDRPSATILGNISFGNIRVNGGNIPAPFDALNILG